MTAADARLVTSSPWDRRYAAVTLGVFSLAFLFAFEALAVATVMPEVVRDLDGLSLYAVAFAAPLATSILALVVAGSTLGMMIANGPAVFAGEAAATRLPLKWIRRAAAAGFAATGLWVLLAG